MLRPLGQVSGLLARVTDGGRGDINSVCELGHHVKTRNIYSGFPYIIRVLRVISKKQGYGRWIFPEIQCWVETQGGLTIHGRWKRWRHTGSLGRLLSGLRLLLRLDAHALVELLLISPQLGLQGVKLARRPRHLEADTRLL